MFPRRLRIIDLLALVAASACGVLLFRDDEPYRRADPTYIACPLAFSLAVASILAAAIAARFGAADRRPFRWGYALIASAYLVLGWGIGFGYEFQPLPSILFQDAMGALARRARDGGMKATADLAEFLCFLPKPGVYG